MANKNQAVSIIGVGACTAIGVNAPMSAASVRAGISRISEHPYMIDKTGEPMIIAMASYLPEDIEYIERIVELGLSAVNEALSPLNELKINGEIPLIVGLPPKRPGVVDSVELEITDKIGGNEKFGFSEIETIPCGHSAGLIAVEKGCRKIAKGEAEFCLAGGADSYMSPMLLEFLDFEEQLHSEANKYGFTPGEAASFCLLASEKTAEKYNLDVRAKIMSVANAKEENLIKTDTVCVGEGLTKTIKNVLNPIADTGKKINQTVCDLNGERYRTDEYGFTLSRTGEFFVKPDDIITPADCWGDTGAASGPLFISLAVRAGLRGYAKGHLTLVWTSSESGERSAALIQCRDKTE
ncbi:beta-ketoacyl synthase N-terminal-like domain-containing protein [Desulfococcaceae bacterium HSG9]|nr:beta-ketoacyl synthase N-terminal-like domain-containing protein [Desulfococcaceae bacterium HSG9]